MTTAEQTPALRKMIDPDEALALVIAAAQVNAPRETPLAEALGWRLAEPLVADRPYPPFTRAMMDGYAVMSTDAGERVRICGEIAAGAASDLTVTPGKAIRIMTGAACPPGADSVIEIERVQVKDESLQLPPKIKVGRNLAPPGSDCAAGTEIAGVDDRVTALTIAAAASVGSDKLSIIPPPTVAIITTGDELAAVGETPGDTQIRDSNLPMLIALAASAGLPVVSHLNAKDTPEGLATALANTQNAQIVILTGGVSAGKYDLVPAALISHGAELIFHKIKQKPGKPLLFAKRVVAQENREVLYFGLPGNPLASHLGFTRYVLAAARVMQGGRGEPETFSAELFHAVLAAAERTVYKPGIAEWDGYRECWTVTPTVSAGSADVFGPQQANCYLELPAHSSAGREHTQVTCFWLGAQPWMT